MPVTLVDEDFLFQYVLNRANKEAEFRNSIIAMYERNSKWSSFPVRVLVGILGFFLRPRAGQVKYFFWGSKFEELIQALPRENVCVVGGPRQLLFCLRTRCPFLAEMGFWPLLVSRLKEPAITDEGSRLGEVIIHLAERIQNFSTENAVSVVDNDSLPAQRAFIQASRIAKIVKIACIQHGVYQSRSPGYILDGWCSDLFLVINNKQRDILVEKGMVFEKIRVLGFHSSPYLPKRVLSSPQSRNVCFFGQPWGKYGSLVGDRYFMIVQEIIKFLAEQHTNFFFKPHPWEVGEGYLVDTPNVVNISMEEALEKYDVFISLTSTALLEAVAAGRLGIQIMDPAFESDRFSDAYAVASLDFNSPDFSAALCSAISSIPEKQNLFPAPIEKRFLTALDSDCR